MDTPQVDTQETVEQWARFVIADWRKKVQKLKIGKSGRAEASFASHVMVAANGDFQKVQFFFRYYLKFVDMGVGKGTAIGQVAENKTSRRLQGSMAGNRRRPKKWQNKVMAFSVLKLTEIMQQQYGLKALLAITAPLDKKVVIKM